MCQLRLAGERMKVIYEGSEQLKSARTLTELGMQLVHAVVIERRLVVRGWVG